MNTSKELSIFFNLISRYNNKFTRSWILVNFLSTFKNILKLFSILFIDKFSLDNSL